MKQQCSWLKLTKNNAQILLYNIYYLLYIRHLNTKQNVQILYDNHFSHQRSVFSFDLIVVDTLI